MSRFLFAWELGLNLGHLTRLQPVALRLKTRGHQLLAAVRDTRSAATVFGPADIPFVQAPYAALERRSYDQSASYADVLLMQGWSDRTALWGLVSSWLNLFQLFKPDLVLVDHSPTALLAARIAGIRRAQLGNGFELPPATLPLPPFPGVAGASLDKAAESERIVLQGINAVMRSFDVPELVGLRDIFNMDAHLLATFPELDHYGAREGACYLGPVQSHTDCERVDWPPTSGARIFAYLRPDMANVDAILGGLALSGACIVCYAPGFTAERLGPFQRSHIRFVSKPVELESLIGSASACVYYGAAGTVARFLLAGVPQLLAPKYTEGYIAACRIEQMGAGLVLRGEQTAESVAINLARLIDDPHFKLCACAFADKYREFDSDVAAEHAASLLESVLKTAKQRTPAAS